MVFSLELFESILKGSLDEITESFEKGNNFDLTKEQYFYLRNHIIPEYTKNARESLNSGKFTKEQASKTAKILTDYIRYQHYKLLDEELAKKRKNQPLINTLDDVQFDSDDYIETEKDKITNLGYFHDWRRADNFFYALERKLWKRDILENKDIFVSPEKEDEEFERLDVKNRNYLYSNMKEHDLIENIPTKGFSNYRIKLINMMKKRTIFPEKLSHIVRKYFGNSA